MASAHVAVAAVLHPDHADIEPVLVDAARDLAGRGVAVAGLVQRNTPNENQGHHHMDLIDVETGQAFRISQDLGPNSTSCCLEPGALASAGRVLRRAAETRPAVVLVNRFGALEAKGEGFADEILALASEGIPVLTLVAERHKAGWQDFTGRAGLLLPPAPEAIRRWLAGLAPIRQAAEAGTGGVLADTIAGLRSLLGDRLDRLTVERAVVGQYYTGVKLSDGSAGASFTPAKPVITSANCRSLPAAVGLAGRCRGMPAAAFLDRLWADQGAGRALGVAVVNALADACWRAQPHPGWELLAGLDALSAAELRAGQQVVMVGAFVSYIQRLKTIGQPLAVLELDPVALLPDELPFYRPAGQAAAVVPTADVLLMTGSTVLNDTIDDLLALAEADSRVLVVGPSVPLYPDVLGDRGADLLATIRITDPDHFLDVLAEGGGTQGTYDGSAELVVLRRRA